jgi:Neuraminidase (sialidase)
MIIESFTRTSETTINNQPAFVTFQSTIQTMEGAIYTTFLSVRVEVDGKTVDRSHRFDNYHSEAEAFTMATKVMTLSVAQAIEYVKVRPEVV